MTLTRATSSLGGLVKGRLKLIRVLKRGVSPRIVRAELVGTAGTTTVTGPQLRRAFGLRDTWIRFRSFSTDVSKQPAPPVGGQLPERPRDSADDAGRPDDGRRADELGGLRIHGVVAPATRRAPGRASSAGPARAGCAPSTSRSPAAGPTRRRCPARAPTACGTAARRGRGGPESLRRLRRLSLPVNSRASDSATQTGFSSPSRSNVCVTVIWMPPGTSSTFVS